MKIIPLVALTFAIAVTSMIAMTAQPQPAMAAACPFLAA